MKNYYFLAASLPELRLGSVPDLSFSSLEELLKTNLSPRDYRKTVVIRRYSDIQNIRLFWRGEELNSRGSYDLSELEDALLKQAGLPDYVYDFLNKYAQMDSRLKYFQALVVAYFQHEKGRATGFLKNYLTFEREWRLVLMGFRAKKLGRDLEEELQFEDLDDEVVAQLLAQKDSKGYEPPTRYSGLKAMFEAHGDAPLELHQALCEYRFQTIEEMCGPDQFSFNRILGHLARHILVEEWLELDKQKGMNVIDIILKEAL